MEAQTAPYENSYFDGDDGPEGSESSDSFDQRQLIGAERDDTDPLPGIKGLNIAGEAKPGKTVQACGFTVYGTVRCDFVWVRFYDDGSRNHIAGENTPVHLVTADDVDSYLAIEVIPIGKNEQLGDLVRIFANEKRKITCDNQMQAKIERFFFMGRASFNIALMNRYSNWENVKLGITRTGFKIKDGKLRSVLDKKFLPVMTIIIPKESATGFELHNCAGLNNYNSLILEAESSRLRDIIVLTMRTFILRATQKPTEKRRGKCFFF